MANPHPFITCVDDQQLTIRVEGDVLFIGDISERIRPPSNPLLVPDIVFHNNPRQTRIMMDMLKDYQLGSFFTIRIYPSIQRTLIRAGRANSRRRAPAADRQSGRWQEQACRPLPAAAQAAARVHPAPPVRPFITHSRACSGNQLARCGIFQTAQRHDRASAHVVADGARWRPHLRRLAAGPCGQGRSVHRHRMVASSIFYSAHE